MSRILALAVEWGELESKPSIPRHKEPKGRIRTISSDELELMSKALPAEMQRLLIVLVDTGMRLSEALRIDPSKDVDSGYIRVWENKADHPRSIPMTSRVAQLLSEHGGFTLGKDEVERLWSKARKDVGLDHDKEFVLHALRHTTASRLVAAGQDLRRVQEFMGHKSIQTTLRYAHLSKDHLVSCKDALESDY